MSANGDSTQSKGLSTNGTEREIYLQDEQPRYELIWEWRKAVYRL
jgi:hypothetical protein